MRDCVLAIDNGGTKLEAALVWADGTVLESSRHRVPTGPLSSDDLESNMFEAVQTVVEKAPADAHILGIGIGTAGPIDRNAGTVSPMNTPAWRQYPMIARLQSQTSLPIQMILDGQAITLAEHWQGSGRGSKNMMGMIVSTGIGGGIISGGRLLTGRKGNAGHIGNMMVPVLFEDLDPDPSDSPIPDQYALERNASGPSTVRHAQRLGLDVATGEELADIAVNGTAEQRTVADRLIELSGRHIGAAIVGATVLLELERVVIAGGFSKVSPKLFDAIRNVTENHYYDFVREVQIVPSEIADDAPLIGAAASWFVPEYLAH